jgi:xanthine dehydrogenase accessory factor
MKDLRLILKELSALREEGLVCAVATVVRVEGSAYRGPGARMLVRSDGSTVGTVNGGCLERDVVEQAVGAIAVGRSCLLSYDTTDDGDIVWGLALGCKGVIDIWIEVCQPEGPAGLGVALERCSRDRAVLVTAYAPDVVAGCRLLWWGQEVVDSDLADATLHRSAAAAAETAWQELLDGSDRARSLEVQGADGPVQVLVEPLQPPLHLVIFGAGSDAQPLARLAGIMGWEVTVVDPRPGFARSERFPEANAVIRAHPEQVADKVDWRGPLAVQLMTHNYLRDLALLKELHRISDGGADGPDYIGILGPRQRTQRLVGDLDKEGVVWEQPLWGPAGLDIGAESAEEIALAITAEIQAVRAGRPGGALRLRPGAIHSG